MMLVLAGYRTLAPAPLNSMIVGALHEDVDVQDVQVTLIWVQPHPLRAARRKRRQQSFAILGDCLSCLQRLGFAKHRYHFQSYSYHENETHDRGQIRHVSRQTQTSCTDSQDRGPVESLSTSIAFRRSARTNGVTAVKSHNIPHLTSAVA